MLNGLADFYAAVAAVVVGLILVRIGGEFLNGHAIKANRWFRDRND